MPFEYVGVDSLGDPAIFQQVLASSVADTGLAYDLAMHGDPARIDDAFDAFRYMQYRFLDADTPPNRGLLGIAAIAMHSVSVARIVDPGQIYFLDDRVVGLHAAAIRKNPSEAVALTFGLSIIELEAARASRSILSGSSPILHVLVVIHNTTEYSYAALGGSDAEKLRTYRFKVPAP